MLDGRRLDANGVPQELTEEERENLSPEELAMGGNRLITEESKQAAAPSLPTDLNSFMNIMGSTITNVMT